MKHEIHTIQQIWMQELAPHVEVVLNHGMRIYYIPHMLGGKVV